MANNVARIHVRFNLDDEIHKKVYNYLERLDENSTKSKNQFMESSTSKRLRLQKVISCLMRLRRFQRLISRIRH